MELTINVPEGIEEVKFIFPTHKNTVKKDSIVVVASRSLSYGGFVVKKMEVTKEFINYADKEALQAAFNTLFGAVLTNQTVENIGDGNDCKVKDSFTPRV